MHKEEIRIALTYIVIHAHIQNKVVRLCVKMMQTKKPEKHWSKVNIAPVPVT